MKSMLFAVVVLCYSLMLVQTSPALGPLVPASPAAAMLVRNSPAPMLVQTSPAPMLEQNSSAPVLLQTSPAPILEQNSSAPVLVQTSPDPMLMQNFSAPMLEQTSPAPVLVQTSPAPMLAQNSSAPMLEQNSSAPARTKHINFLNYEFIEQCNATYPIYRDPDVRMHWSILTGRSPNLTREEQCFVLCNLQKSNALDEHGNMINSAAITRDIVIMYRNLKKYSNMLFFKMFQIGKLAKGIQDKCLKAEFIMHRITEEIYALYVADNVERQILFFDIGEAIKESTKIDHEQDPNLQLQIDVFIILVEAAYAMAAKKLL